MPTNEEMSEKTKIKLFEAGLKLFGEQGFHRTKLSEIADLAGMTRGAIYWHFKNKLDFYKQLIENCSELICNDLIEAINIEGSPKEKLTNLILVQCKKYLYEKQYHNIGKLFYRFELESSDHDFANAIIAMQTSKTKPIIMDTIKKGKEIGQIKSSIDDENVYAIISITSSGLAALLHTHSKALRGAKNAENIITAMLNVIFTDKKSSAEAKNEANKGKKTSRA